MRLPRPVAPPGPPASLAKAVVAMPEPRHPNGWRSDLAPLPLIGILHLAVAAMVCGCRSLYAVGLWGRNRVADLARLGERLTSVTVAEPKVRHGRRQGS